MNLFQAPSPIVSTCEKLFQRDEEDKKNSSVVLILLGHGPENGRVWSKAKLRLWYEPSFTGYRITVVAAR